MVAQSTRLCQGSMRFPPRLADFPADDLTLAAPRNDPRQRPSPPLSTPAIGAFKERILDEEEDPEDMLANVIEVTGGVAVVFVFHF